MATAILPPLPVIPNVEVRHIPGWPGYAVTDDGRVFSCKSNNSPLYRPWKERKSHLIGRRIQYFSIILIHQQKQHNFYIHSLVLMTFVGPRPHGFQACHNDGNPLNNSRYNLRWDTQKHNDQDRLKHGTTPKGTRNKGSKIDEKTVLKIREMRLQCYKIRELVEIFTLSRSQIKRIIYRKSWTHI